MKKLLFFLVSLGAIPFIINAQDELPSVIIDGTKYQIVGDDAILALGNPQATGEFIIPEEIEYEGKKYSVTSIAENAFMSWNDPISITSFNIPETVEVIGDYAFYNTAITELTIPITVKKIGNRIASGCRSLKTAEIFGGLESLGAQIFQSCESLERVNVGEGHTVIPQGMFSNCKSLYEVSLPSSLMVIEGSGYGGGAFYSCYSLVEIDLPMGLKSIGEAGFSQSGLVSVNLPEGLEELGSIVFAGCASLQHVTLPNSLKELPEGTFSQCKSLESIEIPDEVTTIRGGNWSDGCFLNCTSLKKVKLGNSIKEIGGYTFNGCNALSEINMPESLVIIGANAFSYCSQLREMAIGPLVESIGDNCFSNMGALEKITVDPSNKNFSMVDGVLANYDRTELIVAPATIEGTIILPASIRILKSNVFCGCSQLTGLELNEGLQKIEANVISDCPSLNILNIPASVVEIDTYAFRNSALTSFNIDSQNKTYATEGGLLLDKTKEKVLSLVITQDKVVLPESIQSIETNAFANTSIKEIVLNEGLYSIEDFAFSSCLLSKIIFPESLEKIGTQAFYYCYNLQSIEIPENIKSFGNMVFSSSGLEEISFRDGIKEIPEYLCQWCSKLKKINLGRVEKISDFAFWGNAVDSLYLPNSVISIGQQAFSRQGKSIKFIKCEATVPPELGYQAFGYYIFDTEVQVPEESLELYRNSNGWKDLNLSYIPNSSNHVLFANFQDNSGVLIGDLNAEYLEGETLDVSFRIKASKDTPVEIYLGWNPDDTSHSVELAVSSDWMIFNGQLIANMNDDWIGFHVNDADIYIDDVIVRKPGTDENLAKNGCFESLGVTGWSTTIPETDNLKTIIDDESQSSVGNLYAPASCGWNIYTIDGHFVETTKDKDRKNTLPRGIYIINGKKYIIR